APALSKSSICGSSVLTNSPGPSPGVLVSNCKWPSMTVMLYQSSLRWPPFCTLSTNQVGPKPRKARPPEVMVVSVAVTVFSSVVPSLSNSRPVMLPPTPQTISKRDHLLAPQAGGTEARSWKPKEAFRCKSSVPVLPPRTIDSVPVALAPKPTYMRPGGAPAACAQAEMVRPGGTATPDA